jgi:putative oxidoreductase
MSVFGRFSNVAYLLMRVVFAFLLMSHGYDRVIKGIWPALPLNIANVIEVIAGPLLLVGLFTPVVAFIASGEMAVAYFLAHAPRATLPLNNMGEITVALCFGFLYIATRGGGRYSIDALRGKA